MIIDRLTDLYHFKQRVKNNPHELINQEFFKAYITQAADLDFCETVFCYGMEARDDEDYSREVLRFINFFVSEFEKRQETIRQDIVLHTLFNVGLANMRLYYCKRTGFNTTTLHLDEEEFSDDNQFDIVESVNHLRETLRLLAEVIDKAPGLYFYQVIKTLDYAWSVLDNYKVNNDDKPIDLDSSYIWIDQLDQDDLWLELISQMRVKYGLK